MAMASFVPLPRAPVPTCLCSGKITVTIETTGSGNGEIELCLLFYSEINIGPLVKENVSAHRRQIIVIRLYPAAAVYSEEGKERK